MFRPGLEEIAVDLEALLVGDVEVAAPASKGLATGVGVIPVGLRADSLGFIPVYRQVYDGVVVQLAKASGLEPLGVDSLFSGRQHAHVELDTGNGAVGVPLDGHSRVPVPSNHFEEVLGRRDVLLSRAETDPEDPPGSRAALAKRELATSVVVLGGTPAFLDI